MPTDDAFAPAITPPYYAVIFASRRVGDPVSYAAMADRMHQLAMAQPGYLGIESTRDATGFGITVSYWSTPEAIRAWKDVAEHRVAQETGIREWYSHYELRVARVERAYSGPAGGLHPTPWAAPEGS